MEQAKWNHFTDDEIAREPDWAMREHMRRTRGITDQPVPLHLGHLTFMIPLNYLGYGGIDKIDLKEGLRFDDARSGPIKFFLPDFSGLTPRRVDPRTHTDRFVQYNFGIRSYTPPREYLAQFPEQYRKIPDFIEFGLEAYLSIATGKELQSDQDRRKNLEQQWIGESVHGADILMACRQGFCNGHGKNPIGGYDYSFSLPQEELPRWKEIELGVHTKLMHWLVLNSKPTTK